MSNKLHKLPNQNPVLLKPDKINPYYIAYRLFRARLRWDLDYRSWVSRSRMKNWKDANKGKKGVILCNGPSLNKVDFEILRDENIVTFGLNKINLLFDRTEFRPTCIVAVNPLVVEQNRGFYHETNIPLFIDAYSRHHVRFRSNVVFMHSSHTYAFARDCSYSICQGSTVTYVAMQLAFHMGIRELTLVGCDHSFGARGLPHQTVQEAGKDSNHFDPNYFANGDYWQLPDLLASELSYRDAGLQYESNGGVIYNSTDGGELEIFKRLSLKSFIQL